MTDLKAQIVEALKWIAECHPVKGEASKILATLTDPNVFVGRWETDMSKAPRDARILVYSPKYQEQFVAFLGVNPEDGDEKWVIARGETITFIVPDPSEWAHVPPAPRDE